MNQQTAARHFLVHALQTLDMNLADVDLMPSRDVKFQIQHRRFRGFIGHRRIDLREGIALLLQRSQQPAARGQHIGGHGELPRLQIQRGARIDAVRPVAIDVDFAKMINLTQGKADRDLRVRAFGQCGEHFTQTRIDEGQAIDLDDGLGLVVPEALEHRGEPVEIAARAADQSESDFTGAVVRRDSRSEVASRVASMSRLPVDAKSTL